VVLRALAEADQGKTYKLAHPYSADMPLFGARNFVLRIPAAPTGGPLGENNIVWNDESWRPRSARSARSSMASGTDRRRDGLDGLAARDRLSLEA
jgi:hypothetical protein